MPGNRIRSYEACACDRSIERKRRTKTNRFARVARDFSVKRVLRRPNKSEQRDDFHFFFFSNDFTAPIKPRRLINYRVRIIDFRVSDERFPRDYLTQ